MASFFQEILQKKSLNAKANCISTWYRGGEGRGGEEEWEQQWKFVVNKRLLHWLSSNCVGKGPCIYMYGMLRTLYTGSINKDRVRRLLPDHVLQSNQLQQSLEIALLIWQGEDDKAPTKGWTTKCRTQLYVPRNPGAQTRSTKPHTLQWTTIILPHHKIMSYQVQACSYPPMLGGSNKPHPLSTQ